ncbi:L-seryl-tRNA(Sec) selenium transferase [Roseimaritima multifibrata]|uniref:L-seryl-tRNA(Sec) selenium transferase n=2 Tax=Roseimaritima multifibrata TaxID=1930274 RepID=A0A517MDB5_9BACT|nr:L-seryl-tRNA(Sec) selenium transferase [Roseimaritima multifibrata]
MAIPHWTVDLLKRQLSDVAEQLTNPDTVRQFRTRANSLLQELPQAATRVWDQAKSEVQQQWGRRFSLGDGTLINASGIAQGGNVEGPPLLPAVIAAGTEPLAAFRAARTNAHEYWKMQAQRACEQIKSEDLLVAGSVEGAVLAIANLASLSGATIFIPRCCALQMPSGIVLPDLLAASKTQVRELGSSEGTTTADWQRAAPKEGDIIIVAGDMDKMELPAKERKCLVVRILADATVHPLPESVSPTPPTIAQTLAGESDVVIVSGNGLISGPECGLICGSAQAIQDLAASPLWPAVCGSHSTWAMMLTALQQPTPLSDMLEVSQENLNHRAQNLAIRFAASTEQEGGKIGECKITNDSASLVAGQPYQLPSYQLRLKHSQLSALEWQKQLMSQSPALLTEADGDSIVVDLRWVDVNQDDDLAAAICGSSKSDSQTPSPQAS